MDVMRVSGAVRGFGGSSALTPRASLLLTGIVAGVAAMYFLDTQSGRRRRALARDKLVRAQHLATDTLHDVEHDVENRSRGLLARAGRLLRGGPVEDEVLVERVRAKLGHVCSHPRAIQVTAKGNGCIELKGPVLARERFEILAAISSLPGVRLLDDDLEVHGSADVPALAGEARHAPFLARHWNPTTRFLVGATGTLLAARGFSGGLLALPRIVLGAGLLGVSLSPSAPSAEQPASGGDNEYEWSAASSTPSAEW